MHSFKDNENRTWQVKIDVAAVKRVRGLLSLDLYALIDDGAKGLGALISDPVRLIDTVYCLCKDQVDKAGLTDEAFGCGFSGDSLGAAADALTEELIDFFPESRARGQLRQMAAKGRILADKMLEHSGMQLEKVDLDLAAQTLIDSLTNAQASPVLTPTPEPSAS